jgi:hypothetical protein
MDRERAQPEDLPPLELRELRDLELEEASAPGRPAHVAAGSGVVRRGDHAYVIGDDELFIAVYCLSDPAPGRLERVLGGELPADDDERKSKKADLEALTALPPFEDHPFGALFGIGSGSGPGRDRGFVWALAADGTLRGEVHEVDLAPLYDRLRDEIGALNVEGCSVMGDTVWLLHRGNDGETGNVVAELSLEDVMGSLRADLRIDAHELARICSYELGELKGVPLTFSDATPLTSDLLVFTASAEGEDGAIHGSVIGTLGTDGRVQRLRAIDRRWKVEGVHASVDTGVLDLLFVCDQDDPETPSPLLGATMPLEAAFEPRDQSSITAPGSAAPA